MGTLKIALIGAGQRGRDVYSDYIARHGDTVQLVAVAEPNEARRRTVSKLHHIEKDHAFADWWELLAQEKLADAVIIATNDEMHYEPTELALRKGYHILLEKPMSNKGDEIRKLGELARNYRDRIFTVAHVLRYTPFFENIRCIVEKGTIGRLISIQHNENIGFYHFAHSFVRGNWRNAKETSPLVLAKSCHDMDILLFLTGSSCRQIASFGSRLHFRESEKPEGAASRCMECALQDTCPYSAKSIYLKEVESWPANIITEEHTKEGVLAALETTNFGACVYGLDNTVVDHQVSVLEFENGVTATFNLCAFTHEISRTIKLMGAFGEIRGDMERNVLEIYDFASGKCETVMTVPEETGHVGHGGGDDGLMDEFVEGLLQATQGECLQTKTAAEISVESHRMALAAEYARIHECVVNMKDF